jgi:hypothetical protein
MFQHPNWWSEIETNACNRCIIVISKWLPLTVMHHDKRQTYFEIHYLKCITFCMQSIDYHLDRKILAHILLRSLML